MGNIFGKEVTRKESKVERIERVVVNQKTQITALNHAFTDLSERIVKLETEVGNSLSNLSHRVYSLEKKQLEEKQNIKPKVFGPCSIGDRYKLEAGGKTEKYILAQPNIGKVCLICLQDGIRWSNPIEVWDVMKITEKEFASICSCSGKETIYWQKVYKTREPYKG